MDRLSALWRAILVGCCEGRARAIKAARNVKEPARFRNGSFMSMGVCYFSIR